MTQKNGHIGGVCGVQHPEHYRPGGHRPVSKVYLRCRAPLRPEQLAGQAAAEQDRADKLGQLVLDSGISFQVM